MRTVYGNLTIASPRLRQCNCQPHETKSFCPLAQLLPEKTSPELLFLEAKWASLASYRVTADLMNEVMPVDEKLNDVTIRNHLFQVAERMEQALGEEQGNFIDGCQNDWDKLPIPDGL